nr:hypothetical protein [Tanacetum cinerariifolium]
METIHVNFDELPQMASDHVSSDHAPECQRMALEHDSLSLGPKCQENVPHADKTVTTSNDLDLLFSLMFDELLNGSSQVVSKSSAVTATDAPHQRQQQQTTPLNNHTTPESTCHDPTQAPTVTSTENMNQTEMNAENAQVADDEFINIFYHPLEQVIGNPLQSLRTRRQLESDSKMCMFALTVSLTDPKNIKEDMADSAWIESMQEELHQFDRLDGYAQKEGVDFKESFAPVSQLEAVRLFIAMVEALMYLTASRPDIMHATCYCARYLAKPTEKHLTAVKRIFRYLKDTIHMGLWYSKDIGFDLTTFSDSDHAGCLDSQAKYVSLSAFCAQVLWMRTQLTDYGFHFDKIHIYHFIKEKVEKCIVELFFVGTEYQLADLFTEALPEERFKYLVRRFGMRSLTPAELEALANESA